MAPYTVDIIFLAHKRHTFSATALMNLIRNTQWARAEALHIYTDGDDFSPVVKQVPGFKDLNVNTKKYGGPVAVLNNAVRHSDADFVCKIDNDTMVPSGWLEYALEVLAKEPKMDLLGLEAWAKDQTVFPEDPPVITADVCMPQVLKLWSTRVVNHVGGIGLFRRSAFEKSMPKPNGRFGFTEWQWANTELKKAFLDPPLPVFLLDHLPFSPWVELSKQYEIEGSQRCVWGKYPLEAEALWSWWAGSPARVEVVSGRQQTQ